MFTNMQQENNKRKILFVILLFSLSTLISLNIDSNSKINAYGQTPDPSTDPGAPADNSTDLSTASAPSDNSTDLGSMAPTDNFASTNYTMDPLNQTNSGIPNDVNASNNTSSQVTSSAIPEFGSIAQFILIVGIFSMIFFRTKFSNAFKK